MVILLSTMSRSNISSNSSLVFQFHYNNLTPSVQLTNATTTGNSASSALPIAVTAVSLALNCGALLDFTIRKGLRTPFIPYIIVLLFSNILYLTINGTLIVLTQSFSNWRIGKQACSVHIYNRYIMNPVVLHIHLLIGINRGWAMTFPLSYKTLHTFKFAWIVCLAMVLYIHICQLPGFILDAAYYRPPLEKGCWVNTKQQFSWEMFTTFWMFAPKLLIPLAYPFLVWKWIRMRIARTTVAVERSMGPPVKIDSQGTVQTVTRKRSRNRPFIVLTFMTITALITWTPGYLYYGMVSFDYPPNRLDTLNRVQGTVSRFQALVDPLIYVLGTSSLYSYAARIWKRGRPVRKVTSAS